MVFNAINGDLALLVCIISYICVDCIYNLSRYVTYCLSRIFLWPPVSSHKLFFIEVTSAAIIIRIKSSHVIYNVVYVEVVEFQGYVLTRLVSLPWWWSW